MSFLDLVSRHKPLPTFSGISLSTGMAESNEEYQHGKPTEGMCCLCTMEDITEEAQNYGEKKERWGE